MKSLLMMLMSISMLCSMTQAKFTDEFRAAFEKTFKIDKTFAVVMKKDIPTTSVYGVNGDQTDAYYSIDIKDGEWTESEGFFDLNQTAADTLKLGEVMELKWVNYAKGNRIDLRFVALEAHKVTRTDGIFNNKEREPVSTNFKFIFPFDKEQDVTAESLPTVMKAIEAYLTVFKTEDEARSFSAKLISGSAQGDESKTAEPPKKESTAGTEVTQKEIKVGMSYDEVTAILGKPQNEVKFENSTQWTYPTLTVIFEDGKVKQVKM